MLFNGFMYNKGMFVIVDWYCSLRGYKIYIRDVHVGTCQHMQDIYYIYYIIIYV